MKRFLIALFHLDKELKNHLSKRLSLKPTIKYIKQNCNKNINAEQPFDYLISTYNYQIYEDLMLNNYPMIIISLCKVWRLGYDLLLVKYKNKYYLIN